MLMYLFQTSNYSIFSLELKCYAIINLYFLSDFTVKIVCIDSYAIAMKIKVNICPITSQFYILQEHENHQEVEGTINKSSFK